MWLNSDYLQFLILSSYANIYRTKLTKKRSVQNPEYNFQPEPEIDVEDTYHEIDDNMVRVQLTNACGKTFHAVWKHIDVYVVNYKMSKTVSCRKFINMNVMI